MAIESADYYADEELHGNYQYVTLESIINDYAMSRDEDDYTSLVPRYKILYQARRAFRELYFDVTQEIRAIELDLSHTLTVTLPPDFVNYVRVSWVHTNQSTGEKQLIPMAMDNKISIAEVYLQDHNYDILFDSNGCVLQSDNNGLPLNPDTGEPYLTDDIEDRDLRECSTVSSYTFCDKFEPNKNMANVFANGKYRMNKNEGTISFGSDAFGKSIVLEYISDGLYTGCEGRPEEDLRIHKFAEDAVLDFIFYRLIKNRRNVPAVEKQRARKEYFNSRRITKRRMNTLRKAELLQSFKGANKWNKIN